MAPNGHWPLAILGKLGQERSNRQPGKVTLFNRGCADGPPLEFMKRGSAIDRRVFPGAILALVLCACGTTGLAWSQEESPPIARPETSQPAADTRQADPQPAAPKQSPPEPAAPQAVPAAPLAAAPIEHPWANFPVGSWRSVRVLVETLDEAGKVSSSTLTETKGTLLAADAHGYSLRIESTVEIAGKQFKAQPQVVRHGYFGEAEGQEINFKRLGEEDVTIDGRVVKSQVQQAVYEVDGIKRTSTIHYSDLVPPYQLKRVTVTDGLPVEQRNTTTVETIALEMPHRVLDRIRGTAIVKTTRRSPQGTKVTLEVHDDDVPGAVVSHTASEFDATGKVLRRSTLELIDYAIGGHPDDADPVVRRRRQTRMRGRRME